MLITKIRIENFCSCRNIEVDLSQYNPIIGYNNSGKSNIIRAINWLLKKVVLSEHMFWDDDSPVNVEGIITGARERVNLLPQNQQAQINPFFNANDELEIRRHQPTPNCSSREVKLEVKDASGVWRPNPTGIENAISALFPEPIYIQAMDDASDDIGKFGAKNTIGLLLKYTLDEIRRTNAQAVADISEALQRVGEHLNGVGRIAQIDDLEHEATSAVQDFFPGLNVHLRINAPELEDLVKGATVSMSDVGGASRPFTSFGHGAQRSVQMALIRLLASHINNAGGAEFGTVVLLIDEPELYLHPQAIEILRESLKVLTGTNFQVIFSTHSPLLIGKDDVLNTTIVYKDHAGITHTRERLVTAAQTIQDEDHHSSVVFSLQNSTYLLFSEKIILAEGKTEKMLVPDLYRHVRGLPMHIDKTCLIEATGSGGIKPMMDILRAVGYSPKAIVDLDYVFRVAAGAGLIQENDQDIEDCRQWFSTNHQAHNFIVDPHTRLPRKGGHLTAAEAFELMAQHMSSAVTNLHEKMRVHDIWVWSKGAIEAHIGIEKSDTARINFINTMKQNNNLNHAASEQEIRDAMAWI